MTITATYSPEDNKIRLYASTRLDAETFARVKAAGFSWAPKQELFVAPKWSPSREDLAIELAGEIEPEEMTLAERAQAKAERLDGLAAKRASDANAFRRAAEQIGERFAHGQPILVGHHSERRARKDHERMIAADGKAAKAHNLVGYWLYRAEGVEAHANHKNRGDVRARRIKTLLAELRDIQRDVNHAFLCLRLWERVTDPEMIRKAVGSALATGSLAPMGVYSDLHAEKITPEEARARCIASAEAVAGSSKRRRYIEHTLNRLSYERELLGPVRRYQGEITPVLLQIFAREHGAHKPAGKNVDGETFTLESAVPFPLHLGSGTLLEMTADEWRDLMQSVGYEVPAKTEGPPPILNFRAETVQAVSRNFDRTPCIYRQIALSKAEFGAIHEDGKWVQKSVCGEFRFRTAPDPTHTGPRYSAPRVAVFLTDSKVHAAPESLALADKAESVE